MAELQLGNPPELPEGGLEPSQVTQGPQAGPSSVAAFQSANNIVLTNSRVNVVGGDSHTHTHVHYHVPSDRFTAIMNAIANHRKIQQHQ